MNDKRRKTTRAHGGTPVSRIARGTLPLASRTINIALDTVCIISLATTNGEGETDRWHAAEKGEASGKFTRRKWQRQTHER